MLRQSPGNGSVYMSRSAGRARVEGGRDGWRSGIEWGKREMEGRGGRDSLGREPIQLQAAVQPWFLRRH